MRAIFIIFPDRFEGFTSLRPFFEKYPEYLIHKESIITAITRKKVMYVHSDFKLVRLVLQKSKNDLLAAVSTSVCSDCGYFESATCANCFDNDKWEKK